MYKILFDYEKKKFKALRKLICTCISVTYLDILNTCIILKTTTLMKNSLSRNSFYVNHSPINPGKINTESSIQFEKRLLAHVYNQYSPKGRSRSIYR